MNIGPFPQIYLKAKRNSVHTLFENPFAKKPNSLEFYRSYLLNNVDLMKKIDDMDSTTKLGCFCLQEDENCHGRVIIDIKKSMMK